MIQKQILDIFKKQFNDQTLLPASHYKDHPKWSSLRALIILSEVELQTHVLLSAKDIRAFASISELGEQVEKQAKLFSSQL